MNIHVLLVNRQAKFIRPYPEKQFRKLFGYFKPGAYFSPAYKHRQWDGIIPLLSYDKVPAGLFLALKDKIEEEWDVVFKVHDKRTRPEYYKHADSSDRPFQNECVRIMRKKSKTGGLILAATGTGKTKLAGQYFGELKSYGVFVVNELGLLSQARKELSLQLNEPVGYIGNMKFKPQRITVATVQTMHRHRFDPRFDSWHKKLEVMVIDEVHEMLSKRNHEIASNIRPKACFGLTATLRHKKQHIRIKATALCGPVIFQFPLKEGVKQEYLTPGVVVGVNIVKYGHKHLDFWSEYDQLIACSRSYNDVLEKLAMAALKRQKHIMALVHRPKHIKILSKRFKYIAHGVAYGAVKVRDRMKYKRNFEKEEMHLLIANQVMQKGISINRVDFIVDGAGVPSYDNAQQKYGRGVRLCSKKSGLIYVDVGFRNPPHINKKDYNYNRFERATKIRRRALKALGVPVYEVEWNGSGSRVLKFAEKKLRSVLHKMGR